MTRRTTYGASGGRAWPKALLRLVLLAAAVRLGSACADPVSVADDSGRIVALETPAMRVVSLAPHATELLFDVGAGSSVVAVSEFSDYPQEARALPRVGGSQGLDLERIVLFKPDLVIAWTSGNSPRQLETLEHLGIAVFRSDPHSFEEIAVDLEKLGQLTGHTGLGALAAERFRGEIETLRRRYADRGKVRVFYQVWNQPLMTVGGHHLISSVIRLCGGQNIFESADALAPAVDTEAVVRRDPEVIAVASDTGRGREELAPWRDWKTISAVRNNQLLVLDPALITRATPRIAMGAEQFCAAIDAARVARSKL